MNILLLFTLLSLAAPQQPQDTELNAALDTIPGLTELCGAVPTAPAKLRRENPFKPLRPAALKFVENTDNWISCANDVFGKMAAIFSDIQNKETLGLVVAHVNADFAENFTLMNEEVEVFTDRVNRRFDWVEKTLVAPTTPRRCSVSTNDEARLCRLRHSFMATHANAPWKKGRIEPLTSSRIEAPQFTLE